MEEVKVGSDPARRLSVLRGHLAGRGSGARASACSGGGGVGSSAPMSSGKAEVQRAFPRQRQEVLRWNGWGYKDSGFCIGDDGVVQFIGKRYPHGGHKMPLLRPLMEVVAGFDVTQVSFSQPQPGDKDLPRPIICGPFVEEIRPHSVVISDNSADRLVHSHGHTCHELFSIRTGRYGRIPDLVVWPGSHQQVERIVQAAVKHNVCIIPFGGGTNVSNALVCPPEEQRMIVSLDMTEMDHILWIDEENLTANVEAGMIGQDLERKLNEKGYTCGHEPDSMELSSVGGWVATRSSGMKKNVYGNIEDLVLRARMVTPSGTLEKNFLGPRNSIGPDIQHFILGSEGILGVITEVTFRIRPMPDVRKYGSIVFPSFEPGVAFVREVARQRCAPASIRLMDNLQFKLGQGMKQAPSFLTSIGDSLKKLYVTKFKGFDIDEMCACTIMFEGTAEEVAIQEKRIYSISSEFGGIPGGEENGRRGYLMTFVIAYIRDLGLDYSFLAESFETSVPWNRILELCRNVKDRVQLEGQKQGVKSPVMISCRVTQTYDAGACVYFYMGFNYAGISDPLGVFDHMESSAREEILASGGSLSHHHGVGKLRKQWVETTLSSTGVDMLKAMKKRVDPENILGCRNILP